MPTAFRGPRQCTKGKTINIFGGTGGNGGGGVHGGSGGLGEGPRVKIVAGGKIMTINKNYSVATNAPSGCSVYVAETDHDTDSQTGFRTLALGDIDLQQEIRVNSYGVVRKLYSAKIGGKNPNVTVAIYQGSGAEQEWRRDVKKYMAIRHPNIVQLYAIAMCGNIHAAVFYDDLIPVRQFLGLYKHSHLSTVYIYAYIDNEFEGLQDYFQTIFGHSLWHDDCTFLIRCSTGRFCVDLVPGEVLIYYPSSELSTQQGLQFLSAQIMEATVIDSLALDQYHNLCYREFSETRFMSVSRSVTVNIGSVFHCPSDNTFDDMVEIAWLPNIGLWRPASWHSSTSSFGELMPDGWTRFNSRDIEDATASVEFATSTSSQYWLSQANHIFSALHILSDFQHYVVPGRIEFQLTISTNEADTPMGFLFLCPPEDFRAEKSSLKWPDYPAYWSLNPSGAERLTLEEAISLGFASFQLRTQSYGKSWDASVYAGLRQLHRGKGFDPDSQDLARHLGCPPYQLSGPLAHIDDEYSEDGDDTNHCSTHEEFENVLESTLMNPILFTPPLTTNWVKILISITFRLVMNLVLSLILFLVLFEVLYEI
ncbi:hypothetical protein MSAN_00302500 [Mycena sanguinolenta]|uniref:Protein kinase domain-containing protein n=1 Tax=Mycena sanguinolenta TaxID=230812 RepID=A0A8H6ZAZ9_9AGAR|nr:hypothetical protein MSAN_00302500 [Mycena sanguinolenta]